jgi:hypothetical protein
MVQLSGARKLSDVLAISLEFLNSYSNVAAGLSKNSLNVQWDGGEN